MSQLNGEPVRLQETREISPPDPDFEPLKVNLYERIAQGGAQLIPLFPYDRAGSIVPCAAAMVGTPDGYGHFFHYNEADEVTVSFGSGGAVLPTGAIYAAQTLHGVNSYLNEEENPDSFLVVTVTQHQAEEGEVDEAMIARCQNCKEEIVRNAYRATPYGLDGYDAKRYGTDGDRVRQFPTILGSDEFADIRNTEAGRTCSACGHVNTPFPPDPWGWKRVVAQTKAVNAARRAIQEAAQPQNEQEAVS